MNATTHYSIIFNVFVLMQLFNELNCRILDDGFNIFARIGKNKMFLCIWIIELIFQVLVIEFTGPVFNIVDKVSQMHKVRVLEVSTGEYV